MEGKGVLFKTFADIDVFDLEINAADPEDVIRFCQMLEPTVGGINLEDIKAPTASRSRRRCKETMYIPVFHDDQHGTAIISRRRAAQRPRGRGQASSGDVRVRLPRGRRAAIATAEHYVRLGVRRENITLCDIHGVGRHQAAPTSSNPYKQRFAQATRYRTSRGGARRRRRLRRGLARPMPCTPAMLGAMARDPLVFALANPDPEITPEEACAVRPDAIIATGRSDYPNQVNNVLGFPFIFRGALDVRARAINEEMKMAATRALAALAREEVPEVVLRAYGVEQLQFGRDYLIPKPFDPRVLLWVAPAVARAAIASGVARRRSTSTSTARSWRAASAAGAAVMRGMINKARRGAPQRVVVPRGRGPRVLRAARIVLEEGIAEPVLLGEPAEINATRGGSSTCRLEGIASWTRAHLRAATPGTPRPSGSCRRRKGITEAEANRRCGNRTTSAR